MKASHFIKRSFLLGLSVLLLAGCSGEKQTSTQDDVAAQVQLINQNKIYGTWQSSDKSFGYEFHASPTKISSFAADNLIELSYQPEGVIYKDSKPAGHFIWTLLGNGVIRAEIKLATCQARPLTICTTDTIQMIDLKGSNEQNMTFEISEDYDLDGKFEVNYEWQLSKKKLPEIVAGNKSFMIETITRGSSQMKAVDNNGVLELTIPGANVDRKLVESSRDDYSMDFTQAQEYKTYVEFYVYDTGYRDIVVNHKYDIVRIYPAFNDSLLISFNITRELEPPAGISISEIDLAGFFLNSKYSLNFTLMAPGDFGPEIEFGKTYHGGFLELYDIEGADNGSANELVFLDEHKAQFSVEDLVTGGRFVELTFDWKIGEHPGQYIFENEERILTMEFLSSYNGRHQVVQSSYDKVFNEYLNQNAYFVVYVPNDNIDVLSLLPRDFQFINLDGIITSGVQLLEDGVVELVNVEDVEGGRWFVDDEGVLIRFECLNIAEVEITDYQECVDSFEFVATPETKTTYSHLSKLTFINKIGDDYLVQYDAAFWGGRWGREGFIRRFSTYYQWLHLPN